MFHALGDVVGNDVDHNDQNTDHVPNHLKLSLSEQTIIAVERAEDLPRRGREGGTLAEVAHMTNVKNMHWLTKIYYSLCCLLCTGMTICVCVHMYICVQCTSNLLPYQECIEPSNWEGSTQHTQTNSNMVVIMLQRPNMGQCKYIR